MLYAHRKWDNLSMKDQFYSKKTSNLFVQKNLTSFKMYFS